MISPDKFELQKFQIPAFKQLVAQFRHLLLFEPGLGKTVICTYALYFCRPRTVLIICPKNAIKVWENHIREWFDGLDVTLGKTEQEEISFHIWRWRKKQQDPEKRRALWRSRNSEADINFYIVTYAGFVRDIEHFVYTPDCIILDEAKRIRNRKSKAFLALKDLSKYTKYIWPLTGTPGFAPKHFWTMLHLIAPQDFGSYWKFINAIYVTVKNHFGQMEIVGFKNQKAWFDILRRKASIMTKAEIGHAETMRKARYVELDNCQEGLYQQYADEMYAVIGDRIDIVSTSLTQVLRFRQLLVCPRILDPTLSIGGAFADLVESLEEGDFEAPIVVFCPFTEAFPHFTNYLQERGIHSVFTLQGGLDPDEQQRRIDSWRSKRGVMLCSIMYAQAFSLEPAKDCFFIGREWDPDDNKQAEERLNRLTTNYGVTAHYCVYEDTYDEKQFEILDSKTRQKRKTLPKVP